jgi:hypothetical protein
MSITVQFTVTTAGRAAAWNANSTGIDLALTHIQLGSGNRVPNGAEVALVTPQQKAAIGSGFNVSDTQIRMSAIFTGALAYAIREVGIWAGDPAAGGILFGYWSQASGSLADKSANLDLVFSHDMILDASLPPGSVTVVVDTAQAAMIADHEAAADPHPQYLMLSELPYESIATNIKLNGTQAVGTRNTVARGDHVHPTDTSRLAVTANAVSASKLLTARTISLGGDATGSASFDGSANATITATVSQATKLRTARTISLTGDVTGSASFDGSANATIAANVAQATKLRTARTISLAGDVTGSASFDGSANATIAATINHKSAIITDTKASGTDGGTSTAGATQVRTLNTINYNGISGLSLASNQITLPAGTYKIKAYCPSMSDIHKAWLYNVTDSTVAIVGQSADGGNSPVVTTNSVILGRIVLPSPKTFEVRHFTNNGQPTTGFGYAAGVAGINEVYTIVEIEKVG